MSKKEELTNPKVGHKRFVGLEQVRDEFMADPVFRVEYDQIRFREHAAGMVRSARRDAGLTQVELASRINTTQSAIARLESGKGGLPSLDLLGRVSRALGLKLTIQLERNQAA